MITLYNHIYTVRQAGHITRIVRVTAPSATCARTTIRHHYPDATVRLRSRSDVSHREDVYTGDVVAIRS